MNSNDDNKNTNLDAVIDGLPDFPDEQLSDDKSLPDISSSDERIDEIDRMINGEPVEPVESSLVLEETNQETENKTTEELKTLDDDDPSISIDDYLSDDESTSSIDDYLSDDEPFGRDDEKPADDESTGLNDEKKDGNTVLSEANSLKDDDYDFDESLLNGDVIEPETSTFENSNTSDNYNDLFGSDDTVVVAVDVESSNIQKPSFDLPPDDDFELPPASLEGATVNDIELSIAEEEPETEDYLMGAWADDDLDGVALPSIDDDSSDDSLDDITDSIDSIIDDIEMPDETITSEGDYNDLLDSIAPLDDIDDFSESAPFVTNNAENNNEAVAKPEKISLGEDVMAKGDKNESQQKLPAKKGGGALKNISIAVLFCFSGIGGGAGYSYIDANYLQLNTGKYSAQVSSDNSVNPEIINLQNEVKLLKDAISQTDSLKLKELVDTYKALNKSQSSIAEEQQTQLLLISDLQETAVKMQSSASGYEDQMVNRLATMLQFVTNVAENQTVQAKEIKETVLREALAVIEKSGSSDSGKQLIKIVEQLRKSDARISQIEAAVTAQKSHLALVEGETEYVKSTVQELREASYLKSSSPTKEPLSALKPEISDFVFVENKETPAKEDFKYNLIGVYAKGNDSYDIYLQRTDAKNSTEFESYWLSPNRASVIPGYGRVLQIKAVEDLRVPYVVVTENGIIRGKR